MLPIVKHNVLFYKVIRECIICLLAALSTAHFTTICAQHGIQSVKKERVIPIGFAQGNPPASQPEVYSSLPQIQTHPYSCISDHGINITFTVVAIGANLSYQWYKRVGAGEWKEIVNANASNLLLPRVTFSDSGSYRARVSNANGSVYSNSAYLKINKVPRITLHPKNDTVFVGDSAFFTCNASGTENLVYVWQEWTSASGVYKDFETNVTGKLSIPNIINENFQRKYRCVARDSVPGTIVYDTSSEAMLIVNQKVKIVSLQPAVSPFVVRKGTNVTFKVRAIGADNIRYQWMRAIKGNIDTISTDSLFSILTTDTSHTGFYWVRVSSKSSDTVSSKIEFKVYIQPVITSQPAHVTAKVSDTVSFKVQAVGYPLTYQWQRQKNLDWISIPGATNPELKFVVTATDFSSNFRCMVSAATESVFSEVAVLTAGYKPKIRSLFSKDTIAKIGVIMTLKVEVDAQPLPTVSWYQITGGISPQEILKGSGTSISFQTAKQDSGLYYCKAMNAFGVACSDTISIRVIKPITIITNLPSRYLVINGSSAKMSLLAQSEGQLWYQWYRNMQKINNQTSQEITISPIDSIKDNGSVYTCELWSTINNKVFDRIVSDPCTLTISNYYNPFKVLVEQIDPHEPNRVIVHLWSSINLATFPSFKKNQEVTSWADSLMIGYKTKGYPNSLSSVNRLSIATDKIKQAQQNKISDTILLPQLPMPNDSCYWFSYSLLWHVSGSTSVKDTLLMPLLRANKILMIDTTKTDNVLEVTGNYLQKTTFAELTIQKIDKLDKTLQDSVRIKCSTRKNPILFDTILSVAKLKEGGSEAKMRIFVGQVPLEKDTVICAWLVKGTNKLLSFERQTRFYIGWDRPTYTGILTADSTDWASQLQIKWQKPVGEVDSLRIWWDSKPIPLTFEPKLSSTHCKDISSVNTTVDTLQNLSDNTTYYAALQVCKDGLWSFITEKSRCSGRTGHGDTIQIANGITIETSTFDAQTNRVSLNWRIDLSTIPNTHKAQFGYRWSTDNSFKEQKPLQWFPINDAKNSSFIDFGSNIPFEQVIHVGLWLRLFSTTNGPGKASYPLTNSISTVNIPEFTWQIISFSCAGLDTIITANNKIILQSLTPMDFIDTIRVYKPDIGSLPNGILPVNGMGFRFCSKNPQIPPLRIGLRFSQLPKGITERSVGLYRCVNDSLQMMYGFERADSVVWMRVEKNDMVHPFLAVADTIKPRISLLDTTSVLTDPNEIISNTFFVHDNISNLRWQMLYGPANQAFLKEYIGYSKKRYDTINPPPIENNPLILNPSCGMAGIILVSDGIHQDTVNISRSIRIPSGGTFEISSKEWEPLNAQALIDDPNLETIFTKSNNKQWVYDPYHYRIYTWDAQEPEGNNDWIEFSELKKDLFAVIPSRVVWCKTSSNHTLQFGPGITTPLREDCTIRLKPNNWTDFSLPYQFDVLLRDVLEATGTDSQNLTVYQWRKSNAVYTAEPIFIPSLHAGDSNLDTLKSAKKCNTYTIFNSSNNMIVLRIPPKSPMSSKGKWSCNSILKQPQRVNERWSINFHWTDQEPSKLNYHSIPMGYSQSMQEHEFFGPLPPSMAHISVGVEDTLSKTLHGYAVQNNYNAGGMLFTVSCMNRSEKPVKLYWYTAAHQSLLPESFFVSVIDPETGLAIPSSQTVPASIDIGSMSTKKYIIAIGNENFHTGMLSALKPIQCQLLAAYPNPFKSILKVSYSLPAGITAVKFLLYDVKGRLVYSVVDDQHISKGLHTFTHALPHSSQQLVSGVYVLRLVGITHQAKNLFGGRLKLIRIQ